MTSTNPFYIIALVLVLLLVLALKLTNPHKKYSTEEYWQTATLDSVFEVPEEALTIGNTNGSVLMWASMGASDPEIITALVERGAEINEPDPLFSGTPLTGAAGYSGSPDVIRELVRLGADIKVRVFNDDTALSVAAMYNTNAGIIEVLVLSGADIYAKNAQGDTALDLAISHENVTAEQALLTLMDKE